MSTISKTTITFVVMHRSDEQVDDMSLEELAEETNTGHMVGSVTRLHTTELDESEVPENLKLLGNDGSFFNDDLAQEYA